MLGGLAHHCPHESREHINGIACGIACHEPEQPLGRLEVTQAGQSQPCVHPGPAGEHSRQCAAKRLKHPGRELVEPPAIG